MRRRIDLAEARSMLLSRAQLDESGVTERQLQSDLSARRLIRVHRGSYVSSLHWNALWWEGQHLLKVLAVRAASAGDGPIFTHTSAAVLWGLPMFRTGARPVQTLLETKRHSRTEVDVVRRDMRVDAMDIVEVDGVRLTSRRRTVFDVARTQSFESSLCCADAELRRVAVDRYRTDADAEAGWRENLMQLAVPGLRGVRQARRIIEFADGRAQLPGESVSRAHLRTLGFSRYDLQVPVTGTEGERYWVDFAFRGSRRFGEFDGEGKYTDPDLRDTPSAHAAVLAEKRREDDIRGVTGWSFARWGNEHIRTADALGARLAAFGIHPPG
ncbi:hypothetical protein AB0N64_01365 [Microbacterium sp. NPDC089318]